ncbi:MAG: RNA polymerase sigma factor [bacterium]
MSDPGSPSPFLRFRSGDASAFDSFVAEYTGPAYATAVRVLGDPARAEEAVQDAFVRIWQRASQFDPVRGHERSWILAIVRNQAIDTFRKRLRTMERSIDDTPAVYALRDPSDTWQTVLDGLTATRVREALDSLPREQQEVVVKAYYEGVRPVEIARQLNIPEGTVRSRLRLGLGRLRESLGPVREELRS